MNKDEVLLTDVEIVGAREDSFAKAGLPITDIIRYASIEDKGIALAQARKIGEWGFSECTEHGYRIPHLIHLACDDCLKELKEAIGL